MSATIQTATSEILIPAQKAPETIFEFTDKKLRERMKKDKVTIIGVKQMGQGLEVVLTDKGGRATKKFNVDGRPGELESLDGAIVNLNILAKNPPKDEAKDGVPQPRQPVAKNELNNLNLDPKLLKLIDDAKLVIIGVKTIPRGPEITIAKQSGEGDPKSIVIDGSGDQITRLEETINNVGFSVKSATKVSGGDLIPASFREWSDNTGVALSQPEQEGKNSARIVISCGDITFNFRYDPNRVTRKVIADFRRDLNQVLKDSQKPAGEVASSSSQTSKPLLIIRGKDIPKAFDQAAQVLDLIMGNPTRGPDGRVSAIFTRQKIAITPEGGETQTFENGIGEAFRFKGKYEIDSGKNETRYVIDSSEGEIARFRAGMNAYIQGLIEKKEKALKEDNPAALLLKNEVTVPKDTKPAILQTVSQIPDADFFGVPRYQQTPGGKLVLTAIFDGSERAIANFKAAFDQMVQSAEQHRAKLQKPAPAVDQKPNRVEGLPERYYKTLRQHGVKMVDPERSADGTTRVILQDLNPLKPSDAEPHPDIVDFEGGFVRATFTFDAKSSRAQFARFQEAVETLAASAKPYYEAARGAHIDFSKHAVLKERGVRHQGVRLINPKWNEDDSPSEVSLSENPITVTAGRGTDLKAYEFPGGMIRRPFPLDANRSKPEEHAQLLLAVETLIKDAAEQRAATATKDVEAGRPRVAGATEVPLPVTAAPKPKARRMVLAA